jgi:hypothetical protein
VNEMDLLRELAAETPLPAPADLAPARARLTDALAAATPSAPPTTPAASAPPAAPDAPPPAPVLSAVRFMYGGAITSAAYLIVALAFTGDIRGHVLGHRLTDTPLVIAVVTLVGLAVVGLWLWLARAARQGQGWVRVVSTVLAALATLELTGTHGLALAFAALTWLSGAGAVWMLWRPAASAFFRRSREERRVSPPAS